MAENKTPQVTVIDPVGQEKAKLRVAAYARVSSDSTDQLNSYLAQVERTRTGNWQTSTLMKASAVLPPGTGMSSTA